MAWSEDRLAALRRLRLAHPAGRRRQRHRGHRRAADRGRARRRPAVADRRAHPHRLRQPEQAGLAEGARRAARSRRGPPDQGGLRLGSGPARSTCPTTRWRSSARPSRTATTWWPTGRRASPPTRTPIPTSPPSSGDASPVGCADGWDADLKTYDVGAEVATRNASQDAIQALAARVPELFGGAADLSESNLTDVKGEPNFSADEPGRNLRFGVREHAMGGIANGIAYHGGFIPYDATFLTFSDYMRGVGAAVGARRPARHPCLDPRLGRPRRGRSDAPAGRALRGPARDPEPVVRAPGRCQRDGRGLGDGRGADGRAGRPGADPPEAADAGRHRRAAPARACGAAATSCARRHARSPRGHPHRDRLGAAAGVRRRRGPGGRRHVHPGRVTPLLGDVRAQQDQAYRDTVLPPRLRKRVSVEIGVSLGWERWVGDEGAIIGLDHFGASAPAGTIFEHFGFTAGPGRGRRPAGPRGDAARPRPDRRRRPLRPPWPAGIRRSSAGESGTDRTAALGPGPQLTRAAGGTRRR